MAGTKAGSLKRRQTMIAQHGSKQAYLDYMREMGSVGGAKSGTGGFYYLKYVTGDVQKIREAGSKGGRISKPGTRSK